MIINTGKKFIELLPNKKYRVIKNKSELKILRGKTLYPIYPIFKGTKKL